MFTTFPMQDPQKDIIITRIIGHIKVLWKVTEYCVLQRFNEGHGVLCALLNVLMEGHGVLCI